MQNFCKMICDNSKTKRVPEKISRSFLSAQQIFFLDSRSPLRLIQTTLLDYFFSPNFWKLIIPKHREDAILFFKKWSSLCLISLREI